jgi:hypothetical protein
MKKRLLWLWVIASAIYLSTIDSVVVAQWSMACIIWDKQTIAQRYIGTVTLNDKTLADLLIVDRSYPKERFAIVTQFCDTILWLKPPAKGNLSNICFENDGFLYDPRQSLFVYSLCTNMDKRSDIPQHIGKYKDHFWILYPDRDAPVDIREFVQDVDMNTLWWIPQQWTLDNPLIKHTCDPKWPLGKNDMQSCNFSRIIANIIETVLNEYTNFWTAAIYGFRYGPEEEQREKAIKEFVERHFNGDITDPNSPCNDPDIQYIQKSPSTFEGDKAHCWHPKTYKMLDDTIKWAYNLIKNAKIIDKKKVYETLCTLSTQGNAPQSLHACALMPYGTVFSATSREAFKNLMLNELFYYELFIDFYTSSLSYSLHYVPTINQNLALLLQQNNNEVRVTLQDKQLMRNAVMQTTRLLWQLQALYPIHIWLSAYYEDLITYRDNLVAVYTPLHQLFTSLLRNAQEKK